MLLYSSFHVEEWLCVLHVLTLLLVLVVFPVQVDSEIACNVTNTVTTSSEFCGRALFPGSECVNGFCSNPFQSGCLYTLLNLIEENEEGIEELLGPRPGKKGDGDFNVTLLKRLQSQKRVCNSQDPPNDATNGGAVCSNYTHDPSYNHLINSYLEVRIHGQSWASSLANAWLLQIILTEILMVPVTLEAGAHHLASNFYDAQNSAGFVQDVNQWETLSNAAKAPNGDCRLLPNTKKYQGAKYESCAHVIPEYWDNDGAGQNTTHGVEQMLDLRIIERPQPLGAVGYRGLYVTKFTAVQEPSLTSYLGLAGEQNRQKLAELFQHPTTWIEYCNIVSNNSCAEPDGVAQRAPRTLQERHKYHVPGLYLGHFRALPSNNCTANPTTCTGHVGNVPCESTLGPSLLAPWIYHLDLPLSSQEYTYLQRSNIWQAANATRSHFISIESSPDGASALFLGSDAELMRITFPNPTEQCRDSRVNYTKLNVCGSDDPLVVFGGEDGACDYFPYSLEMLLATSLRSGSKPSNLPEAIHSPAFDTLRNYQISHLQMGEILKDWTDRNVDPIGFDPRLATCKFIYNHLEEIIEHIIPKTYPRVLQQYVVYEGALDLAALSVGGLATVLTIITAVFVIRRRDTTVMKHAQVDFLLILLVGLLMVSTSSIVGALEPTDVTCIVTVWLIELGYTLELMPLIVKVTAINRLMAAAKKMRRVQIKRSNLFAIVFGFALFTIAGMTVWTIVDPLKPQIDFVLEDQVNDQGETIVTYSKHCSSSSPYWFYGAMVLHFMLLMWAAVLAFQTRKIPQKFRESTVLAAVIYSQAGFLTFRAILLALPPNTISSRVNSGLVSLATGLDSLTTLLIYFIPKLVLFHREVAERRSQSEAQSSTPHHWPPSNPPTFASGSHGYVTSEAESANGDHHISSRPSNGHSNNNSDNPQNRETELLREEKEITTKLLADLQREKDAMRREIHTLNDENNMLSDRVGELEAEVAQLRVVSTSTTKGRKVRFVEPPPPDEIDTDDDDDDEQEDFVSRLINNDSVSSDEWDDHFYV